MVERLFIYLDKEVLKARRVEPYEKLTKPLVWKDLEFEYTTSPLLMINWPIILPELSPKTARSLLDLVGARYQFSPNYKQLQEICPELIFKKEFDEWVFYGGTFNPWHKGHQACLNLLPEDKLCFILPDRSPLKELKELEPVSTIIELVSKIKFGKNHYIAPTFLLDFQKNPTVTWIEKLHHDFPNKKLSLLMGFDSLKNIMKWVRPEELLNMIDTIYVSSRLEDDEEREAVAEPLRKMASKLNIVFLGRHEFEGLSSTDIRASK
jgi:nicotinic acid mononucleotide adenylyltransferase